jgi:hypothetical protein
VQEYEFNTLLFILKFHIVAKSIKYGTVLAGKYAMVSFSEPLKISEGHIANSTLLVKLASDASFLFRS